MKLKYIAIPEDSDFDGFVELATSLLEKASDKSTWTPREQSLVNFLQKQKYKSKYEILFNEANQEIAKDNVFLEEICELNHVPLNEIYGNEYFSPGIQEKIVALTKKLGGEIPSKLNMKQSK